MAIPEIAANALRKPQDLIATREWLGKPVFKDEKRGYEKVRRYVSDEIDNIFQGKKFVQMRIQDVVERCRKEESPITPAYIALESCLDMSDEMRRELLLMLAGYKHISKEKEDRPIEIAALDVIKGFRYALSTVNSTHESSLDAGESDIVLRLRRILSANRDLEGFIFFKKQAKFWNSADPTRDEFIKPYEISELIGEGAKLGAKTYKRMYRIAKKFYPKITNSPKPPTSTPGVY